MTFGYMKVNLNVYMNDVWSCGLIKITSFSIGLKEIWSEITKIYHHIILYQIIKYSFILKYTLIIYREREVKIVKKS